MQISAVQRSWDELGGVRCREVAKRVYKGNGKALRRFLLEARRVRLREDIVARMRATGEFAKQLMVEGGWLNG
jgi:hypothetical protein